MSIEDIRGRLDSINRAMPDMRGMRVAVFEDAPRLLAAIEAVLELCEIAETNVDGSKRRNPNTIHPDAIRHVLDSALEGNR